MFTTSVNTPVRRAELADEQIRALSPSVFAVCPQADVSSRYAFVPTAKIVSRLRESGWSPVEAHEQIVKLDSRRGFQKHLLRFQRRDAQPVAGEYSPELVLINSHDRSSAYQLHAGLFRFVCGNGMIVADATFERVSIRHSGFTPDEVIEASFKLLDNIPAITARVDVFRQRQLSNSEVSTFAEAALKLRFEDTDKAPINHHRLLDCRRDEDSGNDLWHVFIAFRNICFAVDNVTGCGSARTDDDFRAHAPFPVSTKTSALTANFGISPNDSPTTRQSLWPSSEQAGVSVARRERPQTFK